MSFSLKRKAIIFTYRHPKVSKKITSFRSSFQEVKKFFK